MKGCPRLLICTWDWQVEEAWIGSPSPSGALEMAFDLWECGKGKCAVLDQSGMAGGPGVVQGIQSCEACFTSGGSKGQNREPTCIGRASVFLRIGGGSAVGSTEGVSSNGMETVGAAVIRAGCGGEPGACRESLDWLCIGHRTGPRNPLVSNA